MGILMDKFKARSGREVVGAEDGSLMFAKAIGYLSKEAVFDAEEYFQAKRDAKLGRWRWPLNPDWVAVEGDLTFEGRTVVVVNERTLDRFWGNERVRACAPDADAAHQAARAYFDAHPAPKPWHDAAEGEFWAVVHSDDFDVCRVVKGRFEGAMVGRSTQVSMPVTHHSIRHAERISLGRAS
jgi:hypothetical protein